mgnify:CR=1 FL=1
MNEDQMSPYDMDAVVNEIKRGKSIFSKRDLTNNTGVIFSYIDLWVDRLVKSGAVKSLGNGLFTKAN